MAVIVIVTLLEFANVSHEYCRNHDLEKHYREAVKSFWYRLFLCRNKMGQEEIRRLLKTDWWLDERKLRYREG